ncbi:hypothetical protein CPC08DRAFT_730480 [Agrocybe pediades]|nr:hypothetical protein CPC08DRAFT_730480 [Agrocybe pediades]
MIDHPFRRSRASHSPRMGRCASLKRSIDGSENSWISKYWIRKAPVSHPSKKKGFKGLPRVGRHSVQNIKDDSERNGWDANNAKYTCMVGVLGDLLGKRKGRATRCLKRGQKREATRKRANTEEKWRRKKARLTDAKIIDQQADAVTSKEKTNLCTDYGLLIAGKVVFIHFQARYYALFNNGHEDITAHSHFSGAGERHSYRKRSWTTEEGHALTMDPLFRELLANEGLRASRLEDSILRGETDEQECFITAHFKHSLCSKFLGGDIRKDYRLEDILSIRGLGETTLPRHPFWDTVAGKDLLSLRKREEQTTPTSTGYQSDLDDENSEEVAELWATVG